jgi:pimeloyl-ACP methyl ester carboxylesterase
MLKTIALVAGGGYLLLLGAARVGYRALLYPAPRRALTHPPVGGALRSFQATDGELVQALVMLPRDAARVVVHFHGNGETIADSAWLGSELERRGLGFVSVEYRGYGGSEAARGPTEEGLYADAEGVLTALASEGIGPDKVVLWGTSLGSGVAVEMAVRGHGSRLVLITPYTSIVDVASRLVPILPASFVITDRFDSLGKTARVTIPTLVIHGDKDGLVPYDMGVTLARSIEGAELITIEGGAHNDLFVRARERILTTIAQHALS